MPHFEPPCTGGLHIGGRHDAVRMHAMSARLRPPTWCMHWAVCGDGCGMPSRREVRAAKAVACAPCWLGGSVRRYMLAKRIVEGVPRAHVCSHSRMLSHSHTRKHEHAHARHGCAWSMRDVHARS